MRILFVINSYISSRYKSGGDKIAFTIAEEFTEKSVLGPLVLRNEITSSFSLIESFNPERASVLRVYLKRLFRFRYPVEKFDAIYASSDFLTDTIPALIYKLLNPKATLYGCHFLFPNKTDNRPLLTRLIHWINICVSLLILRAFAKTVFVLNSRDKEILSKFYRPRTLYVLNPFVAKSDVDRIKRLSDDVEDEKIITFLGRLHQQKGLETLIDAFHILERDEGFPKCWNLQIIGDGEFEYRESLMRRANMSERIYFVGQLDGDEKFRQLLKSKIAVFPSHNESQGLVVTEAIASGCIVILSDIPVFKSLYEGSIFFQRGSIKDLAEKIKTLVADIDSDRYKNERKTDLSAEIEKIHMKMKRG